MAAFKSVKWSNTLDVAASCKLILYDKSSLVEQVTRKFTINRSVSGRLKNRIIRSLLSMRLGTRYIRRGRDDKLFYIIKAVIIKEQEKLYWNRATFFRR